MSYGVWTRRGRGWSSIEIDSPWNGGGNAYGQGAGDDWNTKNADLAKWRRGQKRNKGRKVLHFSPGWGEHICEVTYKDRASLEAALQHHEGFGYGETQFTPGNFQSVAIGVFGPTNYKILSAAVKAISAFTSFDSLMFSIRRHGYIPTIAIFDGDDELTDSAGTGNTLRKNKKTVRDAIVTIGGQYYADGGVHDLDGAH